MKKFIIPLTLIVFLATTVHLTARSRPRRTLVTRLADLEPRVRFIESALGLLAHTHSPQAGDVPNAAPATQPLRPAERMTFVEQRVGAIEHGMISLEERIAALENHVDKLIGTPPPNSQAEAESRILWAKIDQHLPGDLLLVSSVPTANQAAARAAALLNPPKRSRTLIQQHLLTRAPAGMISSGPRFKAEDHVMEPTVLLQLPPQHPLLAQPDDHLFKITVVKTGLCEYTSADGTTHTVNKYILASEAK